MLGWPTILRLLGPRNVLRTRTGLLACQDKSCTGGFCRVGGQEAKGKTTAYTGQREFPRALGPVWREKEVRSLSGSNL